MHRLEASTSHVEVVGEGGLVHDHAVAFRRVFSQELRERLIGLDLAFDFDSQQHADVRDRGSFP